MEKKIHSLKQLQKEKEKLEIKMKVTEHAFLESLHNSQRLSKQLLWSKIKLPALAIGTVVKGTQQLLSADDEIATDQNSKMNWLELLTPFVQEAANVYFNNKENP